MWSGRLHYNETSFAGNSELIEQLHKNIDAYPITSQGRFRRLAKIASFSTSPQTLPRILDKLEASKDEYLVTEAVSYAVVSNPNAKLSDLKRLNEFIGNKDFTASKALISDIADYGRNSKSQEVVEFRRKLAYYLDTDRTTYLNSTYVSRNPEIYKIASKIVTTPGFNASASIENLKLQAVYDLEPNNAKELRKKVRKASGVSEREYLQRIQNANSLVMHDTLKTLLEKE